MKTLILIILLSGQLSPWSEQIYEAYITGNMSKWHIIVDKILEIKNKTNAQILETVNFIYGFVAWAIENNFEEKAQKYIAIANKYLENLEKNNYQLATVYAYKSAFLGFEIALNKLKAPFLGVLSLQYANKAIELDQNNYFAYEILGNIYFYSPSFFSDSRKKALKYYLKALKIIEKDISQTYKNWNYLNLLMSIAETYSILGDKKTALMYYTKILSFEPKFHWALQKYQVLSSK